MSVIITVKPEVRAATGLLVEPPAAASSTRRKPKRPGVPVARLSRRKPAAAIYSHSHFEQIALGTAAVSAARQAVLGLLLGSTLPLPLEIRPVLRPIWADEAMQRADDMVRLVVAPEQAVAAAQESPLLVAAEYRVAVELAAAYRSLAFSQDTAMGACSDVLQTAVRDLVGLFGLTVGSLHVRTAIERLRLPMFRRRALALAACHLIADSLDRTERPARPIVVRLTRMGTHTARLRVVGAGCSISAADETVADLASLLEPVSVYVINDFGCATTEITFFTHEAEPTGCSLPAMRRTVAGDDSLQHRT